MVAWETLTQSPSTMHYEISLMIQYSPPISPCPPPPRLHKPLTHLEYKMDMSS